MQARSLRSPRARKGTVLSGVCAEALQAKIGTLSLEAQTKLEKDTAKKEAKAEAKAETALKKKMVRVFCFARRPRRSLTPA